MGFEGNKDIIQEAINMEPKLRKLRITFSVDKDSDEEDFKTDIKVKKSKTKF